MPDRLTESYAACVALARKTAGNFYYAFLTLPRDQFRSMCALYAFMRVTDDLGDSDASVKSRAAALSAWRTNLRLALRGGPVEHRLLPAVADIVQRHRIPVEHLEAVIDGVEMDLRPVAFETFEELQRYCYHVAGAVGLACVHIWGFGDERTPAAAIDCGTAFQLTNILRDLREDIERGRVYLPRSDLAQFGYSAGDLAVGIRDERFTQLMQFQISRARSFYDRSLPLLSYVNRPGRTVLDAMLRIYRGLLDEIERRDYDVFSQRVQLSRWKKLSIAAAAVARHTLAKWTRK